MKSRILRWLKRRQLYYQKAAFPNMGPGDLWCIDASFDVPDGYVVLCRDPHMAEYVKQQVDVVFQHVNPDVIVLGVRSHGYLSRGALADRLERFKVGDH